MSYEVNLDVHGNTLYAYITITNQHYAHVMITNPRLSYVWV